MSSFLTSFPHGRIWQEPFMTFMRPEQMRWNRARERVPTKENQEHGPLTIFPSWSEWALMTLKKWPAGDLKWLLWAPWSSPLCLGLEWKAMELFLEILWWDGRGWSVGANPEDNSSWSEKKKEIQFGLPHMKLLHQFRLCRLFNRNTFQLLVTDNRKTV